VPRGRTVKIAAVLIELAEQQERYAHTHRRAIIDRCKALPCPWRATMTR